MRRHQGQVDDLRGTKDADCTAPHWEELLDQPFSTGDLSERGTLTRANFCRMSSKFFPSSRLTMVVNPVLVSLCSWEELE